MSYSQRVRSITDTFRHDFCASRAVRAASSSSALEDSGTRASTSPVAGFVMSRKSLLDESTQRPPT